MLWLGVTLLMVLVVLSTLRWGNPSQGNRKPSKRHPASHGFDARVDRLIGLLNYAEPEGVENATRHLLSMGPRILPVLFAHLARLEHHPDGISPRCQRTIEELLVDFGLQTYLQCGDLVRSIHRASPILPSVLRVLESIGPNVLIEVARGPLLDPIALLAPLLERLGEHIQDPFAELLQNKAHEVPKAFVEASLIVLDRSPEMARIWYQGASPKGRDLLLEALLPWNTPARQGLLTEALQDPDPLRRSIALRARLFALLCSSETHPQARDLLQRCANEPAFAALLQSSWNHLQSEKPAQDVQPSSTTWTFLFWAAAFLGPEDLSSLLHTFLPDEDASPLHALLLPPPEINRREHVTHLLSLLDQPSQANQLIALCALQHLLDDPRTEPRLLTHAQDPATDYGALALAFVTQHTNPDTLTQALQRRMRSASPSPNERFFLQLATRLAPDVFQPTLLRLLRSESPRLVPLSARLLSFTSPPITSILQAIGRHRYSPLERSVFPLLWAQWSHVKDDIPASITSPNRAEHEAALDIVALFGNADNIPTLIQTLDSSFEDLEAVLNALEMIGPASIEPLEEWAQSPNALHYKAQTQRRLGLLRLLPPSQAP